jgi:Ca2+-transporting ATPase
MIKEYPFTNELKMMGHVWDKEDGIIITSKGAPESILEICDISENEKEEVTKKVVEMASKGMRVIAIAMERIENREELEEDIKNCKLTLCGLVRTSRPSKRKRF